MTSEGSSEDNRMLIEEFNRLKSLLEEKGIFEAGKEHHDEGRRKDKDKSKSSRHQLEEHQTGRRDSPSQPRPGCSTENDRG